MASKDTPTADAAGRDRCPICGESTEMDYRPFCSDRCRDVDLSRWLRGGYAIPGGQADADEDGDDVSAGRVPAPPTDEDGEAAD
ncbi:MAG: DNA gyrase inhibitor YacG [Hyphomicrobium sp.]